MTDDPRFAARANEVAAEPLHRYEYRFRFVSFPSRSLASPHYLIPMLLLVGIAVGVIAYAFAQAPVPPGVDPGHWLATSYAYVGLPTAPDPTNQPFVYAPLLFPILGVAVVIFGNPLLAAGAVAIGLFVLYGLSVVHLARRYLASGPLQVALVGLAMFCGSTIQMLMWGGYPNLLGFVLMNEAMVFLLLFARTRRAGDGAAFFFFLNLTFLGHDLSFAVLLAAVVTAGFFLLVFGRIRWRFLFHRVNVLGALATLLVIGGYAVGTARLGVIHPSYFSSNPAAYYIDEVGEIFRPLATAPAFVPAGPAVVLPPLATALALASAPIVAILVLAIVRRALGGRLDSRLLVGAGWLSSALAVPGVGYLLHVDTDYSRFLYFLPLPFVLVALIAIERAGFPGLVATPAPEPQPAASGARQSARVWRRARQPRPGPTVLAGLAVFVVLALVLFTVTIPVAVKNQAASTATAHDAAFLQAMSWLKAYPHPGNVLTAPSAARWTEALTERDAFTVGPVWLLFNPFQIDNAQQTYWALTSEYAVSNGPSTLSFSGFGTPVMSQAPMYTVYVHGVAFSMVRVLPGSIAVTATGPAGTGTYPVDGPSAPLLVGPAPGTRTASVTYGCAAATLVESGTVLADGTAQVLFRVTPSPGFSVQSLNFTLAQAPPESTTLSHADVTSIAYSSGRVVWSATGKLGQYPTLASIDTTISFSQPPVSTGPVSLTGPNAWSAVFADPNGSRTFGLVLNFATPASGQPMNTLPPGFSTQQFLENSSIRFLLWSDRTYGSAELTYYEATFGYRPVFANAEWVVLEAP